MPQNIIGIKYFIGIAEKQKSHKI